MIQLNDARRTWRKALTEHGIDVAQVQPDRVEVWPLAVGGPVRWILALTSRQASAELGAGLLITVANFNQIAELVGVLGGLEWRIAHGVILDHTGAPVGTKDAGAAALVVRDGWWPGAAMGDPLPDGWGQEWITRIRPVAPAKGSPYLTGPALGRGNSLRSESGRGRLEYAPFWNQSAPWISYYNGTAGRSFTTWRQAVRHYRDHYQDPLIVPDLRERFRP